MGHSPKLVVFDLDYTLWPFWVDTHVDPPFKMNSDGKVYDRSGTHVKYFEDVPKILQDLHQQGFQLGIASRTSSIEEAKELVKLFKWEKYFSFSEIYPGCKLNHFKKFHEQSGLPYTEMLFFDDEYRNIKDVGSLGVTCIHADNGVSQSVLDEGLAAFAMKKC
ncbi:magnesium-dependent phosphatase 1-like [Mytilus edulis]|uniref:magnesium-dependent phosphatase 1-like n=1 Tax=Mytilus edulis TaxID=6550 RepID=UPI0039EEAE18